MVQGKIKKMKKEGEKEKLRLSRDSTDAGLGPEGF